MTIKGEFKQEKKDLKNIFSRFKKRDFSGNTGQAMKNSSYQLTQNVVMKFGSLFFTIILARLLMPELYGLYSLALSTIVLFASFSDLGLGSALMTFASSSLGNKNPKKAKAYFSKLMKWKLGLVFIVSLVLLASSYFVANNYYHKPIFYALLAGGIYLPIVSLLGFLESSFKSLNNFKIPLIKEIVFQISRFTLVPLAILFFLQKGFSDRIFIFWIFAFVCLSYLITFLFLLSKLKKNVLFLKEKSSKLEKKEIIDLKKFIYPLSATALAGVFFGYIDVLMLGHYVQSQFIAYYSTAFSLVASASAIISFMGPTFFPIFARRKGKSLESIFKKSRNMVLIISLLSAVFTFFISKLLILIAYGSAYSSSIGILKVFSILVFILPISGFYGSYLITQKKTKPYAWMIFSSAILNIILNVFAIKYGLAHFGSIGAIYGAVIATILSRIFYLSGLVFFKGR